MTVPPVVATLDRGQLVPKDPVAATETLRAVYGALIERRRVPRSLGMVAGCLLNAYVGKLAVEGRGRTDRRALRLRALRERPWLRCALLPRCPDYLHPEVVVIVQTDDGRIELNPDNVLPREDYVA